MREKEERGKVGRQGGLNQSVIQLTIIECSPTRQAWFSALFCSFTYLLDALVFLKANPHLSSSNLLSSQLLLDEELPEAIMQVSPSQLRIHP